MLTIAAFAAIAIPAGLAFAWMVDSTVARLGTLFAEKQVLYDRYRGMEALMREVALAETLARAPAIKDWALDEQDPHKKALGLRELEHYRGAFADSSYFFANGSSGNYYFNDRDNSYADAQLRYTLSRDNPRDGWYYATAAQIAGPPCRLNVDNDDVLAVTKVWINCLVLHEGRVLGILGTGIDLSAFIREIVDLDQTGVESIFVDETGAVQAHRDASRIDFQSLTKKADDRKSIFDLVQDTEDRARLSEMFADLGRGGSQARAEFLDIDGKRTLVGVGFLDHLGWYNVTFMDVDRIIDRSLFGPIAGLLGALVLVVAALLTMIFKRKILDRLRSMEGAVARLERGDFAIGADDHSQDEIGRLTRAFGRMASAVGANTGELERLVRERTEELERIAYLDAPTGIANRRGFARAFHERSRSRGEAALLLVDIDRFKQINDNLGHHAGDAVLAETVRRLLAALPPDSICGRWGGDEFILLVEAQDRSALEALAGDIVRAVAAVPFDLGREGRADVTASVGGCLLSATDTLETASLRAASALHAARTRGRDRAIVFDAGRHGGRPGFPQVA